MESYKNLVYLVKNYGQRRPNRTGIDTISMFSTCWSHDMCGGRIPLLTTKYVNYKACIHELLWFLKGDTNIKYLNDNGVHIWDAWADKNGDLGPIYGKQWVDSGPKHINQVQYVIDEIKNNPYSRRLIIDGWCPSELDDMALPPCHVLYQFYANPETKKLSLSVYMRSADLFLGVPFDIAEGGILLSLIAHITGYRPAALNYIFGDTHIYVNHLKQVEEQLNRSCYILPELRIDSEPKPLSEYKFDDFKIIGYNHHPTIKGEVAV